MKEPSNRTKTPRMPPSARWLGAAGLLPPLLLLVAMWVGPAEIHTLLSGLALSYSALILSFIGGTWWGLAAQAERRVSPWIWWAAIAPSLIAFAAIGAWLTGYSQQAILSVVGGSLIAALGVDTILANNALCPPGWLRLRTPLSIGLGAVTILLAAFSP